MRLSRLFASLLVLVPTLVIADLDITETRTVVCNRVGESGTPNTCPANRGPSIVDIIKADQARGNPINVLTGNKFEQATDIQANSGDYSLSFNRYYNSKSTQRGILGIGWRHNYEMQLQDIDDQIDIIQADGRQIHFQKTAAAMGGSTLFVTRYISEQSELGYLERTQSSDPTRAAWLWTLPTGKQFQFTAHRQTNAVNQIGQHRFGQLSRVTEDANDPSSPYWALTYGVDGTLAQVRNHTGDTLKFAYETTANGLPKISITSSSQNKANKGRWVYLLDQNNNLAQVVSPTAVRTGYLYQDPFDKHNLTAKLSYDDNAKARLITQWQYDAYDRAISSSHKDGIEKVSVAYDSNTILPTQAGHIFTNRITNSVGETTDYRYRYTNDEAQLLSVIGPSCLTCGPANVSYEYDNAGRVTKTNQLNAQGQTLSSTSTVYDDKGRITKVIQTNEQNQQTWLTYNYDDLSLPTQPTAISRPSVVEGRTSQTKLSYDNSGNIISMTEMGYQPATATRQVQPISRTTTYQYKKINGKQQLTSVDGPLEGNQDTTRYQYDQQNQLTLISYPEGLTQAMSYDTQGRVVTLLNIDGTINKYQYNAQGQVTQSDQAGQVSQINYDPLGRIQQITDPLGQILNYQYDASGQIIGMSDGKQAQIDLTRDTEGNLTAANLLVDGKVEQQTAFETLDAASKQDLLASIQAIAEGDQGNSARPDIAISPYQKLGALLNQAPAFVQAQIEQTDAQGLITTYTADDFGNIVAVNSPTTGISTYQYNQNSLLIGSQSPLNAQTYQRDSIGRVTGITVSATDGSTEQHRITWGKQNKPVKVTYPTGFESFSYNNNAQLLTHTQQVDQQSFTLNYSYDDQGRVQSKTLPDGNVIEYTYNGNDKKKVGVLNGIYLKGIWDKPIITGLNSDNDTSLVQRFNFGNGISNLVQKDKNGRIVLAGNPKVGQTALNYDPNQKQREPEQVTQTASAQMGDAINPQSAISQQVRTVLDQVLYDQNPEPLLAPQNDIIEQISQTPETDEWGRTINQGDQHYEYDSQNRLTKISATDESGKLIPIAVYRYNTFNQRVAKTTYNHQGHKTKTTYYFYDGNQLIAETTDTAGQQADNLKQYVWLNDTPIAILQQGELYYIHTDHRNAPIAVTDNTSKLIWQADNEDFGYATINANSTFELNLRLSNQYYDSESGLHYNTNRYYDALNQQYLTPDPLGLAAGPDLFAFALNQPHSISDPDGLAPEKHKRSEVFKGSAQDKFEVIVRTAVQGKDKNGKYLLATDIRNELLALVSDTKTIATTAGIFVAFAIIQATPVGWLADAAMLGVAAYFLGTAAWDLIKAVVNIGKLLLTSCNYGQLFDAAEQLRGAIVSAVNAGIGLTGAAGASKLSKLFKTLPDTLGLPKLSDSQVQRIKDIGLKPVIGAFKTLKSVINKPYTVAVSSPITRGPGYSDKLNSVFNTFGNTIFGVKPDFIIRNNKDSNFAVTRTDGKLNFFYLSPNKGKEKVDWPDNMDDYLVDQLSRYHKTGYFEDKKITSTRAKAFYDDLVKTVFGNCKGGIPAGRPFAVILLAANTVSSGCVVDKDRVSFNVVQILEPTEKGAQPIVKIFDTAKPAGTGFNKTKLTFVRKLSTFRTYRAEGIAGHRLIRDETNQALWSLPKGVNQSLIPIDDIVGDKLQALVKKHAATWSNKKLSRNEKDAIANAISKKNYGHANILRAQAKGRYVEKNVRNEAETTQGLEHLKWSPKGIDITDPKTGVKYDVMSGSDLNMRTHVERMPSFIWRMLTF
ncbi:MULTISPECIES: DUF6531 domain-containing protein [unclassified Psychrobacter]|uniref:DUF6531 domain-containing protein n=2 Tax=Psychrobacter TaxID=497 RepID=UPI000ECBBBE2|nr:MULTISPECIES: DUF6531 domain-containing protein [unclassified Psychrobacter]HCI76140.1 hypothetical protein [Psychrobacter sp.]